MDCLRYRTDQRSGRGSGGEVTLFLPEGFHVQFGVEFLTVGGMVTMSLP